MITMRPGCVTPAAGTATCASTLATATAVPGLSLFRASSTSTPICAVYRSVLAVAVQGSKRLALADESFEYDSRHYLITSVDLPVMGQITEASPERPYLCAVFDIDPRKVAELSSTLRLAPPSAGNDPLGLGVSALSATRPTAAARRGRSPRCCS